MRIFFILILFLIFGCGKNEINKKAIKNNELKQITVSILPQKYFVEKIVKKNFKINVMIPPGASPATYEPLPQQMKELNKSILYFRIGYIPFEKAWMKRISSINKNMKIIDTSKGIKLIYKKKGIDPHIWLSPNAVRIQLKNILNAFIKIDSKNKEFYKKNYKDFINEIESLNNNIKNSLKNVKNKYFLVYHPTWAYFARDYDLIQIPIEIEGKTPTPIGLKKIIDIARKNKIKVIFDPLSLNWLENMKKIANVFKTALDKK